MQTPAPQSIDANVPTRIPSAELQDFKRFLDVVLDAAVGGAAPQVADLGLDLWSAMAAVVVAWTGLKVAFSGDLQAWTTVRLVVAVAVPRTLLHYYETPIPGVGLTFPAAVVSGGAWLQNLFVSDVVSTGYAETTALVQAFATHLTAAWDGGGVLTILTAGLDVALSAIAGLALGGSLVFGLVLLFCLTYAQVIWAQVAVAVVVLLGPVFIPWLLFEPLAFLFWGWLRALLVYTLHGVVAGAVLRVFMGVGMGYVTTFAGALVGVGSADPAELGLWAAVLLPLVVSGLLAGLKVGELAATLVSGAGAVGSGLTSVVATTARATRAAARPPSSPSP